MMKLSSPAASRNIGPITALLDTLLPTTGRALELASGPGEHAVVFAARYPGIAWQPSDIDADALDSIGVRRLECGLLNIELPLRIDLAAANWHAEVLSGYDAMVAINVCHISPWAASLGLLAGAAEILNSNGALLVYGPFTRDGQHTAPSNEAFSVSLQARNSEWGVRDVEELAVQAGERGLRLEQAHVMPSNNLVLEFRKN